MWTLPFNGRFHLLVFLAYIQCAWIGPKFEWRENLEKEAEYLAGWTQGSRVISSQTKDVYLDRTPQGSVGHHGLVETAEQKVMPSMQANRTCLLRGARISGRWRLGRRTVPMHDVSQSCVSFLLSGPVRSGRPPYPNRTTIPSTPSKQNQAHRT